MLFILKDHKSVGLSALEIIMEQLVVKKNENFNFQKQILKDSNKLSLYLTLKDAYISLYDNMSPEYEGIFKYKVLTDKKNLEMINQLILKQTSLYPRIHSSLPLVAKEIQREKKEKDKLKVLQLFVKNSIDGYLLSEDVYNQMKGVTKFKFLFMGLSLWQLVLLSSKQWASN